MERGYLRAQLLHLRLHRLHLLTLKLEAVEPDQGCGGQPNEVLELLRGFGPLQHPLQHGPRQALHKQQPPVGHYCERLRNAQPTSHCL